MQTPELAVELPVFLLDKGNLHVVTNGSVLLLNNIAHWNGMVLDDLSSCKGRNVLGILVGVGQVNVPTCVNERSHCGFGDIWNDCTGAAITK